jgi:hypothetical protein
MLLIGGSAFEDETAIAIAAVDKADLIADLIINAGVTKRRVDLAGAVAMDPMMLGPNDFRRR